MFAKKIEERRANRIPVTFAFRKFFLRVCHEVSKEEGLKNKISKSAMYRMRDEYKEKYDAKGTVMTNHANFAAKIFGYWDTDVLMYEVLEAACAHVEEVDSDWLYHRDFLFYHTVLTPRVQLRTSPLGGATVSLFLFYLFSAILFCPIMKDDVVCPNRDTFDGWLTSVYFASVTMVRSCGMRLCSIVSTAQKQLTGLFIAFCFLFL